MFPTCPTRRGGDVGEPARSSSRRTSEEGGQLGCLGGMHYREDLVGWSTTITTWPRCQRLWAMPALTRPHPIMMLFILHLTLALRNPDVDVLRRSLSRCRAISYGLCGGPGPCDPHQP